MTSGESMPPWVLSTPLFVTFVSVRVMKGTNPRGERRSVRPPGTGPNRRGDARSPAQSLIWSLISSELPFSSGAYIAEARAGKALNVPGISARSR